jgi:glucose-1-phosphate thymidylyltransferase
MMSFRTKLQLTEALGADNRWFCSQCYGREISDKETLLESNAKLLKKFGSNIAPDHQLENTIVIHPVNIASGCVIKNSIIGPNVAIGEKTTINYSILKDSIIGSFANLYDIVLTHSLIGSDTEVKGESRSLNIGDNTEIDLGES